MRTFVYGSAAWRRYLGEARAGGGDRRDVAQRVERIVRDVRREGDRALVRYTRRFDGVKVQPSRFRVQPSELRRLAQKAPRPLVAALKRMARRIEAFHRLQRDGGFILRLADGSTLAEGVRPIDSVGLYVPGGAGAYPSSVLMNGIPARIAGVPRIVVVSPPRSLHDNPAIAVALVVAGLESHVYGVGGAQAVAALAYGTRTIAPVAKIVGPGNAFVTAAKRLVNGAVAIDHGAGPSEVVVLADGTAPADWVAADLLAQAEHGSGEERVVLVTTSAALAQRVETHIKARVGVVANVAAARRALRRNGAIVLARSMNEAVAAVNALAPEHAEVMTRSPERVARNIVAGAVFAGAWSPVAVGDYGIGPNHVLPTGGAARAASPLSVRDFQRRQSFVSLTQRGLRRVAGDVTRLAAAEGFVGHAASVACRLVRGGSGRR